MIANMNSTVSLYIPYVFNGLDKDYVAYEFGNFGEVSHVDFVAKQDRNGKMYNSVYVHFNYWYSTKTAVDFYNKVMDETREARLYYDDCWYWTVLPNHSKKHIPGERKQKLSLGDMKSISINNIESDNVDDKIELNNKPTYADIVCQDERRENVDEITDFETVINREMDDLETFLESEDSHLISIDGRYVQHLERENNEMALEIRNLQNKLLLLKNTM